MTLSSPPFARAARIGSEGLAIFLGTLVVDFVLQLTEVAKEIICGGSDDDDASGRWTAAVDSAALDRAGAGALQGFGAAAAVTAAGSGPGAVTRGSALKGRGRSAADASTRSAAPRAVDFSMVGGISFRSGVQRSESVRSAGPGARDRSVVGPRARDRSIIGGGGVRSTRFDSSVRGRADASMRGAAAQGRIGGIGGMSDTGAGKDLFPPLLGGPAEQLPFTSRPKLRKAQSFSLGSRSFSGNGGGGSGSGGVGAAPALRQELAFRAATVFKLDGTLQDEKISRRVAPSLGRSSTLGRRAEEGSMHGHGAGLEGGSVRGVPRAPLSGAGLDGPLGRLPERAVVRSGDQMSPKAQHQARNEPKSGDTSAEPLASRLRTPGPPRAARSLQMQPSKRPGHYNDGSVRGSPVVGRRLDSSVRGADRSSQLDPSFRAQSAAASAIGPPPPRSAASLRMMAAGARILQQAAAEGSVRGMPAATAAGGPGPPQRMQSLSAIGSKARAGEGSLRPIRERQLGAAASSVGLGGSGVAGGGGDDLGGRIGRTLQPRAPAIPSLAEDKEAEKSAAASGPRAAPAHAPAAQATTETASSPPQTPAPGAGATSPATLASPPPGRERKRASGPDDTDFYPATVTASALRMRNSMSGKLRTLSYEMAAAGCAATAGASGNEADATQVSLDLSAATERQSDVGAGAPARPLRAASAAVSAAQAGPPQKRPSQRSASSAAVGMRIPSRRSRAEPPAATSRNPSRGRLIMSIASVDKRQDGSVEGDADGLYVHPLHGSQGAGGASGVLRSLGSVVGRERQRRKTGPRGIFGCANEEFQ